LRRFLLAGGPALFSQQGKERADNRNNLRFIGSASQDSAPFASGSLITIIFDSRTFTRFSCPHFGQNSGKLISVVSDRIRVLVFLLQIGQSSHSSLFITSPFFLAIQESSTAVEIRGYLNSKIQHTVLSTLHPY
jgi:hypothetical protein